MPNTFELIASSTVTGATAASIDFTSIPNTFTDLCLKVSARTNLSSVADDIIFRFNNDTAANYAYRTIQTNSSSVASGGQPSASFNYLGRVPAANATSTTFGNLELYIPNYTSSNAKSSSLDSVTENNGAEAWLFLIANRWSGTSAITSIKIYPDSAGQFIQNSTAYLYGVKNA